MFGVKPLIPKNGGIVFTLLTPFVTLLKQQQLQCQIELTPIYLMNAHDEL